MVARTIRNIYQNCMRMGLTRVVICSLQVCLWLKLCSGAPTLSKNGKSPIVETTKGRIQGLRQTFNGQIFDVYKGIPFAAPPLGTRRFERPQEHDAWDGIRTTTNFSMPCTQVTRNVSGEDCLYLNVFVPFGVGNAKSLPVMAYSHGGAFSFGSADSYDCEELAIRGQVVVVTHNYRISSLGGLATRDASAPGNYMLWDARAALIWIRDNIARFGGDPSKVTAFGHSAGSALVSHLTISPMTKGLLHRAIALSGNAASTIGTQYDSKQNAKNLASYENCPTDDMRKLVQCLKQRDAHDVDASGLASLVLEGGMLPGWLPAIDGVMVPELPRNMWNKGAGRHVDFMVGRAEHDAAGFVYSNIRGEPRNVTINLAEDKELLEAIMLFLFQSYAIGDPQDLVDVIVARYPDIDSGNVTRRTMAASQCSTDFVFASPAHFEASAHSRNTKGTGKKTFLYNFKYRASFVHYAPWVNGSHADELNFIFGEPYRREYRERVLGKFSKSDLKVKTNMIAYLTNFAHTGDPNKGPHKTPTVWPEYSENTKEYLEMGAEMAVRTEDQELLSRYDFWLNDWPLITRPEKP